MSHPTAYCFQTRSLQLHSSPQKLSFPLSPPLLEKELRANTACSAIFVCLCARACVHMEVNTSNLALKECSVFCSRPSRCRRPTTTDVHLGDSALPKCRGGETQRSAATRGHAGGEINYCSRRLRNLGPAVACERRTGLSRCMLMGDGVCRRCRRRRLYFACCHVALLPPMTIWRSFGFFSL